MCEQYPAWFPPLRKSHPVEGDQKAPAGLLFKISGRGRALIGRHRLSFYELFDDISLLLNVRRLCVVIDNAAKVCDCVIDRKSVV